MQEKRGRNAERSRQEILAAAEQQFGEKGFYGARIDAIAQQSGLNKNMLYIYYGSKEELYRQVLLNMYSRMEEVERRLLESSLEGAELIAELIGAYYDFLEHNPSFVNILMSENLMQGQFLKQLPHECIARKTLSDLAARIRKGCDEGVFRADIDEKQTVLTMITICFCNFSNRYTLSQLTGCDLNDPAVQETRKKQTIDIMLSYLRAR